MHGRHVVAGGEGVAPRCHLAGWALEDGALGREHLLYALEIAPHFREAQELLLESLR